MKKIGLIIVVIGGISDIGIVDPMPIIDVINLALPFFL